MQENVTQFPLQVMKDLLDDLYHIQAVDFPLEALGWPVNRDRQFIIMKHRKRTINVAPILDDIRQRFLRNSSVTYNAFMMATEVPIY